MTCVNLCYLHLPDSNTCTLCSPSHARHEKPATGRKIKHCKVICKDICEDKHKCRNIPTAFCWATGNKTHIKPAEDRVHERIQITGSSPNDHTDNKTLLENQYACGNKHVRINRAFSSVLRTILWTLKRKKKHILLAGLVIDSCSKWKDYVPSFSFHSFVCRNQSCWEQVKAVGDEAGAPHRDE